jgi:hypothetical protein
LHPSLFFHHACHFPLSSFPFFSFFLCGTSYTFITIILNLRKRRKKRHAILQMLLCIVFIYMFGELHLLLDKCIDVNYTIFYHNYIYPMCISKTIYTQH